MELSKVTYGNRRLRAGAVPLNLIVRSYVTRNKVIMFRRAEIRGRKTGLTEKHQRRMGRLERGGAWGRQTTREGEEGSGDGDASRGQRMQTARKEQVGHSHVGEEEEELEEEEDDDDDDNDED